MYWPCYPVYIAFIMFTSGQPMLHMECLGGVSIPPMINRGDCLCMWKWKLTVDPLHDNHQSTPYDQQRRLPLHMKVQVDCWSSPWWSLIPSKDQQRQSPFHVKVDCWSSLRQSLIPPGSTEAIVFSHKNELILSEAITTEVIINLLPHRINKGLFTWKLTVDPLWGNRHSPWGLPEAITSALTADPLHDDRRWTPYRFRLSNL